MSSGGKAIATTVHNPCSLGMFQIVPGVEVCVQWCVLLSGPRQSGLNVNSLPAPPPSHLWQSTGQLLPYCCASVLADSALCQCASAWHLSQCILSQSLPSVHGPLCIWTTYTSV